MAKQKSFHRFMQQNKLYTLEFGHIYTMPESKD